MNRLQRLLNDRMGWNACPNFSEEPSLAAEASCSLIAPPVIEFPHRLFVPEHFEPRYAYPLLVWLHSDHSSEWELDAIMQATNLRNYLAIAPRAHRVSKHSKRLFRWGTAVSDLAVAEDFVLESIDEVLESLPVHPGRIFVGGVGTGATVAQWVGLKHAERFAGVISINGPFPKCRRALASWKRARHLPVLFAQSESSSRCNDEAFVEAMRLAHTTGLRYRFMRFEEPTSRESLDCITEPVLAAMTDGPEDLDTEMLAAANRFMMGIVTETDIPLTAEEPETTATSLAFNAAAFGLN